MENIDIANLFNQIADVLEILGENKFRISAYRRAAQVIESLPQDIKEIYKQGNLEKIPGIGSGLALKIKELIETGRCKECEKILKKMPPGLIEIMNVEGIGPKKAIFFYKKFKIKNLDQLEKLLKSKRLLKYKGWGEKSIQNILHAIDLHRKFSQRQPLGKIYFLAQKMLFKLRRQNFVDQAEICGSFRRRKETVGDLDFLVTTNQPKKVIEFFINQPEVAEVKAKGPTKATVFLKYGLDADLRVIKPEAYGAALHYFTGSKQHNILIRKMGMERGLKINEYGIWKKLKGKKEKRIGGRKEEEIFESVGLKWIPPELREARGEIEASLKGELPRLVELKDIRGDCHMHTTWSEGGQTIEEMAKAAKKLGYQYIAITDHSPTVGITGGIDKKRFPKYLAAIKRARKKIKDIYIFSGMEVDIRKNGILDLPNEILKQLDIVIGSVHTAFSQDEKTMTQRIIKAMKNPYLTILGHPTGRLLGKREPYAVNIEEVIKAAKKTKTILEINAFWSRLDLNDINSRIAKEQGVPLIINTDAHASQELEVMIFGIFTARRAWLEPKDIVNTLPLEKFKKIIKAKRKKYG